MLCPFYLFSIGVGFLIIPVSISLAFLVLLFDTRLTHVTVQIAVFVVRWE